jgi:hypothetical protein
MEFTPGERAVLGQLRDLYMRTSEREHQLAAITGQWAPILYEAYKGVLADLVRKGLLQATSKGRAVAITDAGLEAMSIGKAPAATDPLADTTLDLHLPKAPDTTVDLGVHLKSKSPASSKPARATRDARPGHEASQPDPKPGMRGMAILIAIAVAACAAWLLWRFG